MSLSPRFGYIEDCLDVSPAVDHADNLGNLVWCDAIEDHMRTCGEGPQSGPDCVASAAANGGDAAILHCFIFLYIAFAGGGAWSLDRAIWRRD